MPNNKTKKSEKKSKASHASEKTSGKGFVAMYKQPDPYPSTMRTKMVYCHNITILSNTTQYVCGTEQIYRLNSLFDTDYTGGTHQPYGFNNMKALYSRYLVHATQVEAFFQVKAAQQSCAVLMSVQPSGTSSSLSSLPMATGMEQSTSRPVFLDTTGITKRVLMKWQIHVIEGITKLQYMDELDDYAADVSTNPTKFPFLRIAVSNQQDTTQSAVYATLMFVFDVEWMSRIILGASP